MTGFRKIAIILIIIILTICFIYGIVIVNSRGIPFVGKRKIWSIGIYVGDSPFSLAQPNNIRNPVLTAESVTDIPADFVADPFMVKSGSTWFMFFEIMNAKTHQGDIGLAKSSDGFNWNYQQVVLDEPFHLSYPYVFSWEGEYFMIPESHQAHSIRLYKADPFPTSWFYIGTLMKGHYGDPSIFYYKNKWWLFSQTNPKGWDTLSLFFADNLTGLYTEHPLSPIIKGNANIAKPAGRVIVLDRQIIRFTQDDDPTYGNQVRAFEITNLTTSDYEEVYRNTIIEASGTDWNANGMHHIDPHQLGISSGKWIACVDGYKDAIVFGLQY